MRTVALLAVFAALLSAAHASAQPKTTQPPAANDGFLADPDMPSMFEMPTTGILDEDTTPGNIVPRIAWLRADYVFWKAKQQIVPPLIQTIPDSLADSTSLPTGAANTLFPEDGKHIRYRIFGGARINTGFWFSREQRLGLDASFFQLEQNSNGAGYASPGSPILARFYNNANSGTLTSLQFSNSSATAGYSGSIAAVSTMSSMWGADASFRWNGYQMLADNTDWLFGVRYFDMRERLHIGATANFTNGSRFNLNDYFAVSNQFYGGQVGFHARWGNFYGVSVDGIVKLAVGAVSQRVAISGDNTFVSAAGVTTAEQVGLYAQPSNIGVHQRNKFAILPEFTLNLNYNLTERAAVYVGYNFFYLSSVMRVGNAIDETVNDSNISYISGGTAGSAAGPTFRYNAESFWLQGINLGFRLEY